MLHTIKEYCQISILPYHLVICIYALKNRNMTVSLEQQALKYDVMGILWSILTLSHSRLWYAQHQLTSSFALIITLGERKLCESNINVLFQDTCTCDWCCPTKQETLHSVHYLQKYIWHLTLQKPWQSFSLFLNLHVLLLKEKKKLCCFSTFSKTMLTFIKKCIVYLLLKC